MTYMTRVASMCISRPHSMAGKPSCRRLECRALRPVPIHFKITVARHVAMSVPIPTANAEQPTVHNPLCNRALTVFYGCPEMPRLSHYFLPRPLFAKKQILLPVGRKPDQPAPPGAFRERTRR